jgi:hypothetical protein
MKTLLNLTKTLVQLQLLKTAFNARAYPKVVQEDVFSEGYSMSDETYGKKSFVYLRTPSSIARLTLERALRHEGFNVNGDYNPSGNTAAVQVSYFKGWHHDE